MLTCDIEQTGRNILTLWRQQVPLKQWYLLQSTEDSDIRNIAMGTWSLHAKSCQNKAMYVEIIYISKGSHIFPKVSSTLYTSNNHLISTPTNAHT